MPSPVITLAQSLIHIPSVSNNVSACLQALECVVKRLEQNHYIHWQYLQFGDDGHKILTAVVGDRQRMMNPDICLFGHLDVVPAQEEQFNPEIEGDHLIGRGASDMKGVVAGMIEAFCHYANQPEHPYSLGLALVIDEEIGGSSTKHLTHELGYNPRVVILPDIGENYNLVISQLGVIQAQCTVTGASAHATRPEEGDNALTKAAQIILSLNQALNQIPDTVAQPTIIEGGTAFNQLPDTVHITYSIRTLHNAQAIAVLENTPDLTFSVPFNESSFVSQIDHPIITDLITTYEAVLGRPMQRIAERGASDARHFMIHNTPVVIFGPESGGCHQNHEWISVNSLEQYTEILSQWLITRAPEIISN